MQIWSQKGIESVDKVTKMAKVSSFLRLVSSQKELNWHLKKNSRV